MNGTDNRKSIRVSTLLSLFIAVVCLIPADTNAQALDLSAKPPKLKFNNATLDIVLSEYAEKTGRTIIRSPKVPNVTITLRSQTELSMEEYLQAIETALSMHGVALIPDGEKFLRVHPVSEALRDVSLSDDKTLPDIRTDKLVSQIIRLKYIDVSEAKTAIDALKHPYATVQLFERINSILITDTAKNIGRIAKVLELIDQSVSAREVTKIVPIRHAKAADIKKKLEEIIAETKKDSKATSAARIKPTGTPGLETRTIRTPSGVIRAKPTATRTASSKPVASDLIETAEQGVISGDVKIVADERTNLLIFITEPENMIFFRDIIKSLDVPTDPDVMAQIVRLEYAEAETIAKTLNSLIGSDKDKAPASSKNGAAGESKSLTEYAESASAGISSEGKSKLGQLAAENIKILPDERTNSLLLMASKSDIAALKEIIKEMDIMLSQVSIRAVIVQIDLDDSISSGIHWVQRSLIAAADSKSGGRRAELAFATSAGGGGAVQDAATLNSSGAWSSSPGLNSFLTFFGLNVDAVINLVSTDSRAQVLSNPTISTTDNTPALISSSQQRYFPKGSTVDQFGTVHPEIETKDIGLSLEVTPHINKNNKVMMEINQELSDVSGSQSIISAGGESQAWPITVKRKFQSSIRVNDGETIVLGGLIRKSMGKSRSKVPILGSIPLIGRLFSSVSDTETRSEVVVFVTPNVIDDDLKIKRDSVEAKDRVRDYGLIKDAFHDGTLASEERPRRFWQRSKKEKKEEKETVESLYGLDDDNARYFKEQQKRWESKLEEFDRKVEENIR